MKLFIFLLGIVLGVVGYHYYLHRDTVAASGASASAQVRDSASGVRDAVADKFAEWHLTPDEIKVDLQKSGQVVRAKAAVAGERISDARIVSVIKAKYLLDRHLSALDINVDCSGGVVLLRGTVAAEEFIARAVVLALETDGVTSVESKLTTGPKTK